MRWVGGWCNLEREEQWFSPSVKCQSSEEHLRGSQGVFEMEEVSLPRVIDSLLRLHIAG